MGFHKCTDLDQVLTAARTLDANKSIVTAKLTDIENFNTSLQSFDLNGQTVRLTEWALSQLLRKLKIPMSYYMACTVELRAKEITEALQKINNKVEYFFKIKDDTVYGIVPKQYFNRTTAEFVAKCDQLPNSMHLTHYDMSLEHTTLRFISDSVGFKGILAATETEEEYHYGVDVHFSEVGFCNFLIQPIILRCSDNAVIALDSKCFPTYKNLMMRFDAESADANLQNVDTYVLSYITPYMQFMEDLKQITFTDEPEVQNDKGEYQKEFEKALRLVANPQYLKDTKERIFNNYIEAVNPTLHGLLMAVVASELDNEEGMAKPAEDMLGRFVTRAVAIKADMKEHDEPFEFTLPAILRAFTKHSLRK